MPGGETQTPDDRVRDALARLGSDSASAPDVPASVTDRMRAALRAAPAPAHAAGPGRSSWGGRRLFALLIGLGAAAAAAAVGLAVWLHSGPSARFPSGPTAEMITVSSTPADAHPPPVTRP